MRSRAILNIRRKDTAYLYKIDVIFVEHGVPESVELGHAVLGGEGERVSASISLWVLSGESTGGVQWLVDVSHIMNEES